MTEMINLIIESNIKSKTESKIKPNTGSKIKSRLKSGVGMNVNERECEFIKMKIYYLALTDSVIEKSFYLPTISQLYKSFLINDINQEQNMLAKILDNEISERNDDNYKTFHDQMQGHPKCIENQHMLRNVYNGNYSVSITETGIFSWNVDKHMEYDDLYLENHHDKFAFPLSNNDVFSAIQFIDRIIQSTHSTCFNHFIGKLTTNIKMPSEFINFIYDMYILLHVYHPLH